MKDLYATKRALPKNHSLREKRPSEKKKKTKKKAGGGGEI